MNKQETNILFITMKLMCLPQFRGRTIESGISDIKTSSDLMSFLEKHDLMETAIKWLEEAR